MAEPSLELVLKRDRIIVLAGLLLIASVAWGYLLYQASAMQRMNATGMNMPGVDMPGMDMHDKDMKQMDMAMSVVTPQTRLWSTADLLLIFVMWAVMMVAMMVPSAAPMILLFTAFNRKQWARDRPYVPTAIFLLGYLVIWIAFSAIAAWGQWMLHRAALLSAMMVSTSALFAGALLIAAGVFQWTPIKNTCLSHCRTPLSFFSSHWREGRGGAFIMGLRHGSYCVGCCWVLMGLLFVAGVMNLYWIAILSIFILLEKTLPPRISDWTARVAGVLLAGWGTWMILK
jgi:predicted metal-binding membrane protein